MNRLGSILAGPEVYWGILYLGFRWLAARNAPPTAAGNEALNWAVWLTATVAVAGSFAFLLMPGANPWVMFVRLALAAFIGVNACVILACDSIKYPEAGRDSGLLALWILAAMVAGLTWCVSAGVSALLIRAKAAAAVAAQPPPLPLP